MFIRDLTNADELPALEQSLRFAAQRQKVIAHNIANIDTPDFRPVDVSISGFRESLSRAVDERRERWGGGSRGELEWRQTSELRKAPGGLLEIRPSARSSAGAGGAGDNVLFQDRNNRSLERLMQQLQENTAQFSLTTELMRAKMDLLRTAIDQTR